MSVYGAFLLLFSTQEYPSHCPKSPEANKKIHRTNDLTLYSADILEVTTRFELVNEGFADLCLTTWPRHHNE